MIVTTNDGLLQLNILVHHMHPSIYLSVPANTITLQNSTDDKTISIDVLNWSSKGSKYSSETEKKKLLKYGLVFNLF